MLKSLYIKNIALIDSLTIVFTKGMNVISGETGAGKSLIVDSLSFVLGERADKGLIKYGKDYALVEAIFDISEVTRANEIAALGFEINDGLILSRTLYSSGRNEIRINGRPATAGMLRQISALLIDIFGQSEHLNILNEEQHLKIIDNYGVKQELIHEIYLAYSTYKETLHELKTFGGNESERERLIELYKYQIEEIDKANLSENEEKSLIEKRNLIINQEKIIAALEGALGHIKLLDNSAYNSSARALANINSIKRFEFLEEQISDLSERLDGVKIELKDIGDTIEDVLGQIGFSQYEADKIEKRLEEIKSIKRKYGTSYSEIILYREKIHKEYKKLSEADETIHSLNRKKEALLNGAYELSVKVHNTRKAAADKLSRAIVDELISLSIPEASFAAEFLPIVSAEDFPNRFNENGFDGIRFMFSANRGSPLKPLVKVMSGGEMSRFMLAVKNITASSEGIPTVVFDEIDSGISGRTAQAVAKKLVDISSRVQSIIISHLPQIVAAAVNNLLIEKKTIDGNTEVIVSTLSAEGKIDEVARLFGDSSQSAHARSHAQELIDVADSLRKIK